MSQNKQRAQSLRVNRQHTHQAIFAAKSGETRRAEFMGVEHLVIPVVMLTETVMHAANSEHPELALAEEFSKNFASWNGRPVVVNHPMVDGAYVSANSPEVLQNNLVGFVFNAAVKDKKLCAEAWVNIGRATELGGVVAETVTALEDGKVGEVSVGIFVDVEDKEGELDGKRYSGVWRNPAPDHLALLDSSKVGACSTEQGCGANRSAGLKAACGKEDCAACAQAKERGLLTRLLTSAKDWFRTNVEYSDAELRDQIERALRAAGHEGYVMAVYATRFIYTNWRDYKLYSLEYTVEGNQVALIGEPTEVHVTYEPVNAEENDRMNKEARVNALIANPQTRFGEGDRQFLMGLEEKQLELFEPLPAEAPKVAETEENQSAESAEDEGTGAQPKASAAPPTPKIVTVEDYLANAPAGISEVIRSALSDREDKRKNLIAAVKTNKHNEFSEDELAALDDKTLQRMAKMAGGDTYLRQVPRSNTVVDETAPPAPPQVFEHKG